MKKIIPYVLLSTFLTSICAFATSDLPCPTIDKLRQTDFSASKVWYLYGNDWAVFQPITNNDSSPWEIAIVLPDIELPGHVHAKQVREYVGKKIQHIPLSEPERSNYKKGIRCDYNNDRKFQVSAYNPKWS